MTALLSEKELESKAEMLQQSLTLILPIFFTGALSLNTQGVKVFLVTWLTGSVHTALIRKTA